MKRTGSTVPVDRQTLWRSSARINGDTRRYEAIVVSGQPVPLYRRHIASTPAANGNKGRSHYVMIR